ncbi:MAG: T9SS type A sorting domain-containing protein [Sphingobacteriales bacterium]|nr:MAG: T9SS type A sorting domain-containing protein [Sphingobacteriales bacterium]
MGVIASGGFKTDSVEIRNTGNAPATLTQLGGLSSPFTIIRPGAGYVLRPKSSVWVVIRYDAVSQGAFNDTLLVESNDPCSILVQTEITAGENSNPDSEGTAQISIGNTATGSDTARSGLIVMIPLVIRSSQNLIQSNTRNYTATISFYKNLLKPAGTTPAGVVNGNRRSITVTGSRNSSDTLGLLQQLQFIAMLGDEACTDISIDSFVWTDGNATATTQDGEFCLSELCQAGGNTRLISSGGGQFMLYGTTPNPAAGQTRIEYNLIEHGTTTLTIIDMLGRTVKTILQSQAHPVGRFTVDVPLLDIPDGLYRIVLQSPSQSLSLPLQVAK